MAGGHPPLRVLITGGTAGIGLGIARAFHAQGAFVTVMGRDAQRAEAVVPAFDDPDRVRAVSGDVADEGDRARALQVAVDVFGGLDVLVNNAGTTVRAKPEDYTPDDYARVLEVNLTSAFALSQMAFPYLRDSRRGRIINIASLTSFFGSAFSLPYAVSKGGIVQLTKSLALAWGGDGITVNAIAPGWIDTDLTVATRQYVPELEQNVIKRTPLGRWGTPEDIGGVAAFLASAEASFVNGTVITVDGGYSASL